MPTSLPRTPTDDGPDWYQDAVIYELHVRSFCDSDGDGIGDFRGPDPRSSTTCRTSASPPSGCCRSTPRRCATTATTSPTTATSTRTTARCATSRAFLREAHDRGLRVITELVLNHTSDQHPWFQRARRAPAGQPLARLLRLERRRRERYRDARIIFKDFETSNWTWDPVAKAVLLAPLLLPPAGPELRQPRGPPGADLDASTSGWSMGVDGLRLDAVPYLYEREGTNCENLPETHAFLKQLRAHVDEHFPNRMLLAEANQWPEDARRLLRRRRRVPHGVPLPADAAAVHGAADGGPLPDHRHPRSRRRRSPTSCQWALFLRNHDELTLEMVTDEERDYMYRVYAARAAGADQPRHPPPARAAARQRPAQDRADERPAVLAAGHAGHLLRRRDRDGRQHLPRRPQRRAHADAVERRPQRRLLARQPAAALPAADHRPRVPLRDGQRRDPGARTPARCCGG